MTKAQQQEKAPAGWENVVLGLKKHPQISNPYALANWMKDQGFTPHKASGEAYAVEALVKRARYRLKACGQTEESIGLAALGQLVRKGVKREAERRPHHGALSWFVPLREASLSEAKDGAPSAARVLLITEGRGNKADRNFYPASTIEQAAPAFEGARCFVDHPTKSEESDRPERTVRDMCGWYSGVTPVDVGGKRGLTATLNFGGPGADVARKTIEAALRYQQQYADNPDKCFAGFSINGEGPSHEEALDEGDEPWNVVDGIDKVISTDLVTFPARGGRALNMREAEAQLASRRWRARFQAALQVAV